MSGLTLAVAQSIATPGDLAESVRRHVRLAALAADQGARLVLFPELSLTGYHRGFTPADALSARDAHLQPLQALADARDLVIVVGAPLLSPDGLHIGALAFVPRAPAVSYCKQHLHQGEEVVFSPGRAGVNLGLAGQTVALAICADIAHAQHAQQAAARGATVYAAGCLLSVDGYAADAALLARYARTHHMAVLMANYGAPTDRWLSAGQSAVWSDAGVLLASAPASGEALVLAERSQGSHGDQDPGAPWSARVITSS